MADVVPAEPVPVGWVLRKASGLRRHGQPLDEVRVFRASSRTSEAQLGPRQALSRIQSLTSGAATRKWYTYSVITGQQIGQKTCRKFNLYQALFHCSSFN
jgi:hypothetical protein